MVNCNGGGGGGGGVEGMLVHKFQDLFMLHGTNITFLFVFQIQLHHRTGITFFNNHP